MFLLPQFLPLLGFLFVKLVASSAVAHDSTDPGVVPGAYIVEFEDDHNDEIGFYDSLESKGLNVSRRMSLDYALFRGSSFRVNDHASLDPDTVHSTVRSDPAVKEVWPVRLVKLPDYNPQPIGELGGGALAGETSRRWPRDAAQPDNYPPHVMTQVDKLRAEGVTGKGIRVGIVDTGVDWHHPALGGCFGPGCLIAYGTDLVGDAYNGTNTAVPDPDPFSSCEPHGTHVAGIVAAQENPLGFTGAAPGVTLGAYRVFGCVDQTANDVLIAAFNQAYEDGSDIITCSVGSISGWTEDPWSVAVSRIVEAGVPCTVAIGNTGGDGMFTSSAASDGKGVTSVGSVENIVTPVAMLVGQYKVDSINTNFTWLAGTPPLPNITLPLFAITPNVTTDGSSSACLSLRSNTPDLSGKVVLAEYTSCGPAVIAKNLKAKGAKYIIFYYNAENTLVRPSVDSSVVQGVGAVVLQQAQQWQDLLGQGKSVILIVIEPTTSPSTIVSLPNLSSGGLMDAFSSWGPTWEVDLKPDVSAPGGDVLSTYPLAAGGYAVASGTSMATPFVAAVYALLMQVRGTKDPATLLGLVMATAELKPYFNYTNVLDGLAPVPQQGSGLIQAYDAAHANTILSPSFVSFNDTPNFVRSTTFTIRNTELQAITYDIGHSPAFTLFTFEKGSTSPAPFPNPSANGAYATLSFSSNRVTIAAGATVSVTAVPTAPEGLDATRLPIYSGFITANGTNGENVSIPYIGVVGSMHSLKTVDPQYTALTHYISGKSGSSWTLPYPKTAVPLPSDPKIDMPAAAIRLVVGTPLLRCDVIPINATNVNTTEVLGVRSAGSLGGFPLQWLPRRLTTYPFTGMTQEGYVVTPGSYAFLVRALKIFGNRNNASDYDTVQLATFNVAYAS